MQRLRTPLLEPALAASAALVSALETVGKAMPAAEDVTRNRVAKLADTQIRYDQLIYDVHGGADDAIRPGFLSHGGGFPHPALSHAELDLATRQDGTSSD